MSILLEAADLLSRATSTGKYDSAIKVLEEAAKLREPYEITVNANTGAITKVGWEKFGALILAVLATRTDQAAQEKK